MAEARRRPTVESVARHAGVSRQTVSNVLNEPDRVRPETRARVLESIAQTGYQPNLAARQLRTSRSRLLGFRLDPDADGMNAAALDRFLRSLTEAAQKHDYRIVLFTARSDADEVAQYNLLLSTVNVDGFVLTGSHYDDSRIRWLEAKEVPFVSFGRPWPRDSETDMPRHSWVDVDGAAGTREATAHLSTAGHRSIAFIGWPEGSGMGDERRRGWREQMLSLGTSEHELEQLDTGVPNFAAEGYRAALALFGRGSPTAVVCASDSLAIGVQTAVRETGRGIAVIGFDDTPVAQALGIASVAQPLEEAADIAMASLVDRLAATGNPAPDGVLLRPRLAVRNSADLTSLSLHRLTKIKEDEC
ncbi:MAG: Transcriptional regulator [Arthrobacter sp.]|nr:Transcriptional regulator [Arthrobacter sp.]MCU1549134.1 Transcriptional regulator [Arthrobacter sp.]